jgi:hypothetical protein
MSDFTCTGCDATATNIPDASTHIIASPGHTMTLVTEEGNKVTVSLEPLDDDDDFDPDDDWNARDQW